MMSKFSIATMLALALLVSAAAPVAGQDGGAGQDALPSVDTRGRISNPRSNYGGTGNVKCWEDHSRQMSRCEPFSSVGPGRGGGTRSRELSRDPRYLPVE
jgi:hypothetical protein